MLFATCVYFNGNSLLSEFDSLGSRIPPLAMAFMMAFVALGSCAGEVASGEKHLRTPVLSFAATQIPV